METQNNFVLNDIFKQNAKVYQTKPVKATKYKQGMENGWMIYISNIPYNPDGIPTHAGVKFFETKEDAMRYVEDNKPEYININGELVECEVEYDLLRPVMCRKLAEGEERRGVDFALGEYVLVSDEQRYYDFFILEDDTWIIQDADGNVRVWDTDSPEACNELFFGKEDSYVCEKVADDTYIEIIL